MIENNRARLKLTAKLAMKSQRPHPMLITLLYSILVGIGSQIVSWALGTASGSSSLTTIYTQAILEGEDPASAIEYALLSFGPQRLALALFIGSFVAGIITMLWAGLMRVGYSSFCLGMVRGQQPQTGALFSAFPRWAGVLLTQFLAGLFRALWALLLAVGLVVVLLVAALLAESLPAVTVILFIAGYIAFLVGLVWVLLRYALVDFVIADQGITGMDAIRESKRLMQGNTGKLFVLNLSFFGWYLLEAVIVVVVISFGLGAFLSSSGGTMEVLAGLLVGFFGLGIVASLAIGIFNLWLTPYVTGAQALFYEWVRGGEIPTPGSFGGQGGWGQPQSPQQHYNYNWNPGPSSGTGIGPGPRDGGSDPGGSAPKPPKPKDDPWE